MALDKKSGRKRKEDSEDLSKLTRRTTPGPGGKGKNHRAESTGLDYCGSSSCLWNDCHFGIYVDSKWKSESGYLYISWTSDYSDCGLYRLHDGRRHQ